MAIMGKVNLVGAGPGDPELLTLRALRMIEEADLVVYDRLVSTEILSLVPETAQMVSVGKTPHHHPVPQDQINALLLAEARSGRVVTRLKGGDPYIFGRGSEEAQVLQRHGVDVAYAPGITAAQGMAMATGVPLTHRGLATGVRYVTGHRAADRKLDLNWQSLADINTTLVVYMGLANITEIAMRLKRCGLPGSLPVLAVANATTSQEARLISTLDRISPDIHEMAPQGPVLFVIGRVVSLTAQQSAAVLAGE